MNFEFSLWNYIDADRYTGKAERLVEEWKLLGITTGCSFVTDGSEKQVKFNVKLINAAKSAGIKMFVYDKRVFFNNYCERGAERYESDVKRALADYAGLDNVTGFIISDEPDKTQLPKVAAALDIFKKYTDKTGFVNFSWCDYRATEYGSRDNYVSELENSLKGKISVVANDRYSCMHAAEYEEGFLRTGIDKFFADLNMFGKLARRLGIPQWTSLLSVGHWMYRTPSETDIRWQLSVSFAHGIEGVQWFFLNQHRHADDYYTYPVDIYGNRTPIFDSIERQTRIFKDKVVKPLEGYRFAGVKHICEAYGQTPLLNDERAEVFIRSDHKKGGILSEFVKDGKKAYLLVNSDQHVPEVFFIYKKGKQAGHIWLDAGGTHIIFPD